MRRAILDAARRTSSRLMAPHSSWASIVRRNPALARRARGQLEASRQGQDLVHYEGYGPGGAAVLIECLTEDRQRLGAQLRGLFREHGGNLGAAGSVSYLFYIVGLLTYPPGTDAAQLTRVALEAGAEDVVAAENGTLEVLADPPELESVRTVLTQRGFAPATAEVTQRAAAALPLSGEAAERMVQLLETLQALDEVRAVYSNAEIADEVLERL
ncbi:MAG TPA: YebC/PmpR family DNA-binding transcriptional regulator [Steroidobacteraceae bacterium]|jgi:transcriptional/translational regulatory protein YebC/TACO1|nr:YebC/PmpR family DNA-binding transcriptional regulator [Steroidobacteraceae bacterium]